MKHPLLTGAVITVGIINIALFGLWFSLVKIDTLTDNMPTYVYNNIAVNFTILQITLSIVAFGTAIAGFFGFQAIKDGAMRRAEETAAKYLAQEAPRLMKEEFSKQQILYVAPHPPVDTLKEAPKTAETGKL